MNEDSFYSMDRLIEFGLEMGVATQMTRMMNESIRNMQVPGAGNPMPQASPLYYAILNGNQAGPFAESEIARLISLKQITVETYMWKPGMADWKKVSDLPDVLRIVALTPPEFTK